MPALLFLGLHSASFMGPLGASQIVVGLSVIFIGMVAGQHRSRST